ncbi:hypothetical protein KCP77_12075 [Salmonella enterica subsp. enterica]|nr:hypothetical protein KCP77_12075 [Salmonella enterica subsp. enterica]
MSLIWRDSDERMAQFVARLNDTGLQFVHGARFTMCWTPPPVRSGCQLADWKHIVGSGARALDVGAGDGPNDAPLLDVMDYAVVVKEEG